MAKKYYTLMVMTGATSKMRKYNVSKSLIKGAVISAAVVFSVVFALGYSYWDTNQKLAELEEYKKEYNKQRVHLQNLENVVGKVQQELTDIRKNNQKFRIMVGLPDAKSLQQVSGIGGESEQSNFQNFVQEVEDAKLKKLYTDIEQLKIDLAAAQTNLQEISEAAEDKSSLLAATPSIRPVQGWMTSGFGYRRSPFTGQREMHKGLDIANRFGTPVQAPADGIVVFSGRKGSLGKVVVVEHGYGYSTRYGHLSELLVKVGEKVSRGQMLARIGSTGRSTAPHLHYEVRLNGVAVNPYNYILN